MMGNLIKIEKVGKENYHYPPQQPFGHPTTDHVGLGCITFPALLSSFHLFLLLLGYFLVLIPLSSSSQSAQVCGMKHQKALPTSEKLS